MKESYQKPDVEFVTLLAEVELLNEEGEGLLDGEMGVESSIF